MSYHIKNKETVKEAFERISQEQVGKALNSVKTDNAHEAIHTIRKTCKKLRGLVRLVREDVGEDFYKEVNNHYRDTSSRISFLRDIYVNQKTLKALNKKYKEEMPEAFYKDVNEYLKKQKRKQMRKHVYGKKLIEEVAKDLKKPLKNIDNAPVADEKTFEPVESSLKKVYKRSLKSYSKAYKKNDGEHFHDFRKRIKYLWYHTKLLKKTWPAVMKKREDEVHHLADLLGDDHDLVVLKAKLKEIPVGGKRGFNKVEKIIDKEIKGLRKEAKAMSKLILAEKPKKYTKRIKKYWEA